ANPIETGGIELAWRHFTLLVWYGRRCEGIPTAFGYRNLLAAFPGNITGGLASRMRQLHGNTDLRVLPDRGQHTRNRRLPIVIPNPEAPRCDAARRLHGSRFYAQQCGARHGQAAEMNRVPVRREPLLGGVLAHGRDENAVRKNEIAQR